MRLPEEKKTMKNKLANLTNQKPNNNKKVNHERSNRSKKEKKAHQILRL
jgi:hypothetical protein